MSPQHGVTLSRDTLIRQLTSGEHKFEWRRPEPTGNDFTESSLTMDNSFHDLDLSSIVPVDTVSVVVSIYFKDASAGTSLVFGRYGDSGTKQVSAMYTLVANTWDARQSLVGVDEQKIRYKASGVFDDIQITVVGWFI